MEGDDCLLWRDRTTFWPHRTSILNRGGVITPRYARAALFAGANVRAIPARLSVGRAAVSSLRNGFTGPFRREADDKMRARMCKALPRRLSIIIIHNNSVLGSSGYNNGYGSRESLS